MFPSFAIRETLFPATIFFSEKQNMFLQQGRKTFRVSASMETMFSDVSQFSRDRKHLFPRIQRTQGFPPKRRQMSELLKEKTVCVCVYERNFCSCFLPVLPTSFAPHEPKPMHELYIIMYFPIWQQFPPIKLSSAELSSASDSIQSI